MLRSLLRKELNKNRIDEKKKNTEDEKEFQAVVEKLSAPEDYSFYQEEELDLLKIKKFEANKNLSEKMIDVHQQKFFWLLNSYHHTQVLSTEHFKKELSALPLKEAEKKLKAIEDMKTNVLNRKKELVKKYNLSSNVEKIAHRLAFCIWWQDQRKKFIFITNAYIDALLMEMSKRFNINFDSLHYYCIEEINKLIKENKPLAEKEISLRKLYFMRNYYAGDNKSKVFCGKDVENIIKPYTEIKIYPNLKEFKGTVVSIGNKSKVKGIVKVVKSGKEIGKVNKGDVLVAPMTAPDYVVGMKKASAIITDEGGITCHAAIVSRELGIPCIVGTGIASKILKDGDVIEVNANHGIVRKIKQE
ncbi:hypothetical protein HY636_00235 [Candidatus Woesearchaeota archaeon]|nr:hypothetical protein [Candidatus Woesearchaeota archaeon]